MSKISAAKVQKATTTTTARPVLQRKCDCGKKIGAGHECEDCKKKRDNRLQRRATATAAPATVPPIVHSVLNSPGRPLDAATRSFMEPRFGRDFEHVRVHTGDRAAESARAVNARAYTVGDAIAFDHGAYQPESPEGRKLLAHELTHTVQQHGMQKSAVGLQVDPADSALEREADHVAEQVMRAGFGAPSVAPARVVQLSRALPKGSAAEEKNRREKLKGTGFEEVQDDIDDVTLDARRFRSKVKFPIPPTKGSAAKPFWDKSAADHGLETLVDVNGRATAATKTKVALKQERDDTESLRKLWLDRVGWTEEEAQANWEKCAKKLKLTAGPFPQVRGKDKLEVCQMDHIIELQIGGTNGVENTQMLNGAPNRQSGQEVRQQLAEDAKKIREAAPGTQYIIIRYSSFAQAGAEEGPCLMMDKAASSIKGSSKAPDATEEYSLRAGAKGIEHAAHADKDKAKPTQLFASGIVANDSAGQMIPGLLLSSLHRVKGTGKDTIKAKFDDRKGTRIPIDIKDGSPAIEMSVSATGVVSLSEKTKKHPNLLFTYPYLSEGKITRLEQDAASGLSGDGELTPSIPLLKGVTLKVHFSPDELSITSQIPTEKLKTPIPGLNITKADLGLVLYPAFKPTGTLEFAVGPKAKPLVEGKIDASVEGGEFMAKGNMTAHIPGVDETKGDVVYSKSGGWKGAIHLTTSKIKGVKTAKVDASVDDNGLMVGGSINFELPGGQNFDLSVERGTGGAVIYKGDATINVPGLKDVKLSFTYDGNDIVGSGETSFSYLGTEGTLHINYAKGDVSGHGELHVKKGKAKGLVKVAMSRAPHKFSGKGQLTYEVTPNLITTVGIEVDEKEKVTVSGAVEFPKPIGLFEAIKGEFKLLEAGVSIPVPGLSIPGVGLMIRIEGGLGAAYGIGPGTLNHVKIEGQFSPFEDKPDLDLQMGASLSIPAFAKIMGSISGSLQLTATIASADGGLKATASAALVGGFSADAKLHYQKSRFDVDAAFKAFMELELGLDLGAFVRLQAGIGPLTAETRWDWNLASYRYKPGVQLGMEVPIHYASDQPFKAPALSDIKFTTPTIDPKAMLEKLFGGTNPREKKG